jgi:VWFA-related protein
MKRLAAAVALVLTAPLAAQEQPAFRSGVHVVEVDVRVFDKSGRFIADLIRDDFELLEDGVPQRLDASQLIAGAGLARPSSPLDLLPAASAQTATGSPQTWIFAFDTNHLVAGAGFDRARKAVEEFIANRLPEGTMAGIVADGRIINNRLTSLRSELLAALKTVRANPEIVGRRRELRRDWPRLQDEWEAVQISDGDAEALKRAVWRLCNDDPDACKNPGFDPALLVMEKARRHHMAIERSTQETLRFINGLASGLGRMPGLKTIVLVSDGFGTEKMQDSVRYAVGQSTRGGARIYSIDVRGLNRNPGGGDIERGIIDDSYGPTVPFDMQADGLNSLAVDTGGLMIRNENNIGRALDTIAADSSTYYLLGYRPSNQNMNGQFRKISVRVKGQGVSVRARAGYLASPGTVITTTPPPAVTTPATAAPPAPSLPATASLMPEQLPGATELFRPSERILERIEKAAARASTSLRMAPDASDARAREGWAKYASGDVEGARRLLAQAAVDTAPAWVFYALGQSEFALRNFAPAIAAFTRVRQRMPELRDVYLDLADAYLQSGDVTNSLATMRDAAARWPQDPEFQNAIGVLHVRRNALDEAIGAFSTAAQLAPSEPLAFFNLGRAYELRYSRGSRYVASMRQWIAPEGDRKKAAENYQRYLELGGPYGDQAREALLRLAWAK